MDLSEVTRLESKELGVKPGEVVSLNTTGVTAQLIDELCAAVKNAMILGSFPPKAVLQKLPEDDPDFTTSSLTPAAERELLLRLADALEAEPRGVYFEQVYGSEHTHTVNLGTFSTPMMPALVECVTDADVDKSATIQVKRYEQLVHYVCALGKIGVVLDGGPRGWRSLGLPSSVRNLIVQLNDGQRLSFAQIAAALRNRAVGL